MSLAAAVTLAFALAGAVPTASAGGELPEGLPEGWYAILDTDAGAIVARLLPEQAPQSVAHLAAFAEGRLTWTDAFTGESVRRPYYDGLAIHRVVAGERFEAGDPTGTGRGAPPVWVPQEGDGSVNFSKAYRVGLTRTGQGRVNGAIFFVTAIPAPWLNRRHPCIGEIVAGREVVDRICARKTDDGGRPLDKVTIRKVTVRAVGAPRPLPDPVPYDPPTPELQMRKPSEPVAR
ncbi:MAG TPA: peptidylprolyl isomerase [Candidatus Polarisedimenticolaceae bacterium]